MYQILNTLFAINEIGNSLDNNNIAYVDNEYCSSFIAVYGEVFFHTGKYHLYDEEQDIEDNLLYIQSPMPNVEVISHITKHINRTFKKIIQFKKLSYPVSHQIATKFSYFLVEKLDILSQKMLKEFNLHTSIEQPIHLLTCLICALDYVGYVKYPNNDYLNNLKSILDECATNIQYKYPLSTEQSLNIMNWLLNQLIHVYLNLHDFSIDAPELYLMEKELNIYKQEHLGRELKTIDYNSMLNNAICSQIRLKTNKIHYFRLNLFYPKMENLLCIFGTSKSSFIGLMNEDDVCKSLKHKVLEGMDLKRIPHRLYEKVMNHQEMVAIPENAIII